MEPLRKLVQQFLLLERRTSLPVCPEQSRGVQAESSSAAAWGQSKQRIAIALVVLLCALIVSSRETLFAQTSSLSQTAPVDAGALVENPRIDSWKKLRKLRCPCLTLRFFASYIVSCNRI